MGKIEKDLLLAVSDLHQTPSGAYSIRENGKILDRVEFLPIKNLINNNKTVVAAVAPSIIGQFGPDVTMDQLRAALMKIGFTDMLEVAFAADMLTIKEAVEFNRHVNGPNDLMITSCCCPMWVGMLKKVYKELAPRYQDRNGGYTRIIKVGPRQGDNAPMAIIEFVK